MTTATTGSLTDRYVHALLSRIPVSQRADIEKELRASIADAVDDHISGGKDPTEAERAVLTELGDPARLASRYTDRPLQLIGPALYLDYVRLLTILLGIVVPVAAGVVGFTQMRRGADAGTAIGEALGTAVTTAVHVAFWTTLLFAVVERVPGLRPAAARNWIPDELPELPRSRRSGQNQMLGLIITGIVFLPLVLISRAPEGGGLFGLLGLLATLLAAMVVQTYASWSVPAALLHALFRLAGAALVIWLAVSAPARSPERVGSPEAARWMDLGFILAAVIVAVWGTASVAGGFVTRSWEIRDWKSFLRTLGRRQTKA